ncbi:unnamed protein product [Blepharisma stoltei]|uniref:Uncharacterized protein n=1 Tax=Blepharisma stoltei TaxID=1481888 RepID=A0AAU9JWC6_9CILI|nr:unnamed protein product [Blepharisma stoltei]
MCIEAARCLTFFVKGFLNYYFSNELFIIFYQGFFPGIFQDFTTIGFFPVIFWVPRGFFLQFFSLNFSWGFFPVIFFPIYLFF